MQSNRSYYYKELKRKQKAFLLFLTEKSRGDRDQKEPFLLWTKTAIPSVQDVDPRVTNWVLVTPIEELICRHIRFEFCVENRLSKCYAQHYF